MSTNIIPVQINSDSFSASEVVKFNNYLFTPTNTGLELTNEISFWASEFVFIITTTFYTY